MITGKWLIPLLMLMTVVMIGITVMLIAIPTIESSSMVRITDINNSLIRTIPIVAILSVIYILMPRPWVGLR